MASMWPVSIACLCLVIFIQGADATLHKKIQVHASNGTDHPVAGAQQDNSGCGLDDVRLGGADVWDDLNGVYTRLSSYCNNKPMYRRYNSEEREYFYLYYVHDLEGNPPSWVVGDKSCPIYVHNLALKAADSYSSTPDQVTSTWYESTTFGWTRNSGIYVNCYSNTGGSGGSGGGGSGGNGGDAVLPMMASFLLPLLMSLRLTI